MKIAQATKELDLKHVVITSVDRDDLEDGGAEHFSKIILETRKMNNETTTIEVLTPDFFRKGEILIRKLLMQIRMFLTIILKRFQVCI